MVTYASLVWWPKTQQTTANAKLQKVQRLACLGITGAMSTCPTAALEAMLNLPPLQFCIRREAGTTALKLRQTQIMKPGDLVGHLKILEEIPLNSKDKPTDVMPVKFDFETPFEVVIKTTK